MIFIDRCLRMKCRLLKCAVKKLLCVSHSLQHLIKRPNTPFRIKTNNRHEEVILYFSHEFLCCYLLYGTSQL